MKTLCTDTFLVDCKLIKRNCDKTSIFSINTIFQLIFYTTNCAINQFASNNNTVSTISTLFNNLHKCKLHAESQTTYILNANLAAPHLLQTQGAKWVAVLVALKHQFYES